MKRIAVLTFVLVFAIAGAALADKKIGQGTGYVGVGSGLALNNMYGPHTIQGGYFVIDGLEVGGILTLDYGNHTDELTADNNDVTTVTMTDSLFGIGAQLAYFFDVDNFMAPFVGISIMYAMANTETETEVEPDAGGSTTTTNTVSSGGIMVMPKFGLAWFVHDQFAMDTSLYVSYASTSGENETSNGATVTDEMTGSHIDLGFMFGLNFFF